MPESLRALRHRNFRLFVTGLGTSNIGMWVQMIASSWLVYELSGSTLMLGMATFCLQIPYLVLTPLAGVFIDRLDVRRVLAVTNSVALLQGVALFALLAGGWLTTTHLVLANLVLGVANAFDAPARQSLLSRMIPDRQDLPNAIALNSAVMNGARFIGPMLGGIIMASLGGLGSFGLNALLRVAVLLALAAMALPPPKPRGPLAGWAGQLAAGIRYAYGFLPTRSALLLLACTSFCLQSYGSMMPWFASEQFHGDSRTLGLLLGAAGLGAVVGMAHLARRGSIRGLFGVLGMSSAAAALSLIAFCFTSSLWIALPMLFVSAMGMMLTAAATNTVLQSIVPDELRGRVAALYVMSFLGVSPLGSLFTGWLSRHLGVPGALAACAAASLGATWVYARKLPAIRRQIAPLYEQLQVPRSKA